MTSSERFSLEASATMYEVIPFVTSYFFGTNTNIIRIDEKKFSLREKSHIKISSSEVRYLNKAHLVWSLSWVYRTLKKSSSWRCRYTYRVLFIFLFILKTIQPRLFFSAWNLRRYDDDNNLQWRVILFFLFTRGSAVGHYSHLYSCHFNYQTTHVDGLRFYYSILQTFIFAVDHKSVAATTMKIDIISSRRVRLGGVFNLTVTGWLFSSTQWWGL